MHSLYGFHVGRGRKGADQKRMAAFLSHRAYLIREKAALGEKMDRQAGYLCIMRYMLTTNMSMYSHE